MSSFGFISPGYQSRSLTVTSQRWVNMYLERIESAGAGQYLANQSWAAYGTPGRRLAVTLGGGPGACIVPAETASDVATPTTPIFFAIAGATLYSIAGSFGANGWTGSATAIGMVASQALPGGQVYPAQIIVINPILLFVVAAGNAYVAGYGAPILTVTFGPAAVPPTSRGSGYAVGDTGLILGGTGVDATYVVTAVDPTLAGSIGNIFGPDPSTPAYPNTGYAVGDTGTVSGGNGDATYVVTFVGSAGDVFGFHLTNQGSGYAVANAVPMVPGGSQPGVGTGFTIDILSVAPAGGGVTGLTITSGGAGYAVGNNIPTETGGIQPGSGSGLEVDITSVGSAAWLVQQIAIPAGSLFTDNFIRSATWMDGYVIVSLAPNEADPQRRRFYISDLNDPNHFDPLEFGTKEANPDPNQVVFAAYETLMVCGTQTIENWWDSGDLLFPFQRVSGGGVIEGGLASTWAICKADGTVTWLGSDARGGNVAYQMRGITPVRISNHAVEAAWHDYSTAGASIYSYQEDGHTFVIFHFPVADKTWAYDSTLGPINGWHERMFWDGTAAHADRGRYHAYAQGVGHAVLDYTTGKVWIQDMAYLDDDGNRIRRIRTAPHVVSGLKWFFVEKYRLHVQGGVVPSAPTVLEPNPPFTGAPTYSLTISNDGGRTFGAPLAVQGGAVGQYEQMIEWYRCGRVRDRVIELQTDDPIQQAWVDMYAEMSAGNGN